MRNTVYLFFVMLWVSVSVQAVNTPPASFKDFPTVDSKSIKTWLDAGDNMVILDVRKESAFEKMHLPEAENCPVNTGESLSPNQVKIAISFLKRCGLFNDIAKSDKLVVYCTAPT